MKPKTIKSILAQAVTDYHDSALNFGLNKASAAVDNALAQIQQLLEECAPELREPTLDSQTGAPVGMDGCIDYGFNQAIDQYISNIREKLR